MRIAPVLAAAILLAAGTADASFETFLERLEKASEPERPEMVDEFLGSNGVPAVSGTTAYFIYCDESASSVSVAGDFNDWKPDADRMAKVPGTCLFYLKKEFEIDARLDYKFVVNGSAWTLDPRNPARVSGGFGPNSELSMPGYVQPFETVHDPGIAHGELVTENFPSRIMEAARKIHVYLPPGYDGSGERLYPVLFVHDGWEYATLGSMVDVADNLLARGDITPVVIVFIDPGDRNNEYKASERFTSMIVTEVSPWVDEKFDVERDPALRGMMGASLGGLISVYITWNHPGLFGFCASQSGAFLPGYSQVIRMVEEGPPREIRFYLDWGTYERAIAESNEDMREAILRGGHELKWKVYPEGHSWGSWRAHVDDILTAFAGREAGTTGKKK